MTDPIPFHDPLREARRVIGEELLAMQQSERRLIEIVNDLAELRGEMRASRERLIGVCATLARAEAPAPRVISITPGYHPPPRLFGSTMRPDADPLPLSPEDKA